MTRFWLFLCLLLTASPTLAQKPPLVVVLLPGTSLRGWQAAEAPNLRRLMASGALAVMNTRTARLPNDHTRETPESAALTLGAGARAAGGPEATDFSAAAGEAINPHWAAVEQGNARLGYRLRIGALADALAAKGIALSAGGGHFSDCLAATSAGTVSRAGALTADIGQCLVWDAGSDVPAADGLIGSAATLVTRRHGRLLVLSPFAGDDDYARGERLTPVLEWGEGVPAGLLRSPSTRRAGLVVNTDFAPTVGAFYGVRREDFAVRPFGAVWSATAAPDAGRQVRTLEEQAVRQARGMRVLPYLAVALAVWMVVGTALVFLKRSSPFWPIIPAVLLVALAFSATPPALAAWFGTLLAAALVLTRRIGARRAAVVLLAILAAALVGDMLTGSRLMQRGLLGYSAIEGARYYGIGNEAMGTLIGVLLVVSARFWQPLGRARWLLLVLLGCVVLLLGSAGAKAGGLLVSAAAFGTLGFGLLGKRWSTRAALLLGMGAVAVLALAAVYDASGLPGAHSHMGEAVRRIEAGGWSEAWDIVARKLAVEGHLAFHSAWACPLWGGLACLWLVWRQAGMVTTEGRALRVAGSVGIASCVAFNDAGVIAGALCLVPLWCDGAAGLTKEKPPRPLLRSQGPGS